ncbi:putative sulfate/molybdate transporter [Kytococcus sedentarius]|uniref:putative sulfate/molybdate transporter n=1 Tax=Kytococcus sedentarius TaxID=1276 RepID=UPI0035BBE2BF
MPPSGPPPASAPGDGLTRPRWDARELAGAVADLGVLVPIAVALVLVNGLSATAVLLPAGLLYVVAGLFYRVPVPVQPLKAFGAIAVAQGLGSDVIAAGALVMGVLFLGLGSTGWIDRAARLVPRPVVRGVQLSVGLLFLKLAWGLATDPPASFPGPHPGPVAAVACVVALAGAAVVLRRWASALVLVVAGVVVMLATHSGPVAWGPSELVRPELSLATLLTATVVLVLPQLPLTFANSCVATADVARTYYGRRAGRVTPGRLASTLGVANLLAGAVGGMPVCHGAGGMTAHRSFGARTGGAPIALGVVLLVLALGVGAGLAGVLAHFPVVVLAALLAVAGALHVALLRDLKGSWEVLLAVAVGLVGFRGHLALALVAGCLVWWAVWWALSRAGGPSTPRRRRPSGA